MFWSDWNGPNPQNPPLAIKLSATGRPVIYLSDLTGQDDITIDENLQKDMW